MRETRVSNSRGHAVRGVTGVPCPKLFLGGAPSCLLLCPLTWVFLHPHPNTQTKAFGTMVATPAYAARSFLSFPRGR